jgi:RimJ/RimL family protein N-acetyltransferase
MCHPAIWETVAEDNQIPETFIPEMVADCWLQIVSDGTLLGLYNVHPHSSVTLEVHAQILPEYRQEFGKESSRLVLEWIVNSEEAKGYEKVIAQIPTLYPRVKQFTLNAGFQEEGINRLSYRKNGQLYDQWLLGITRPEIEAFLGDTQ